jgi:hypothetical protein
MRESMLVESTTPFKKERETEKRPNDTSYKRMHKHIHDSSTKAAKP